MYICGSRARTGSMPVSEKSFRKVRARQTDIDFRSNGGNSETKLTILLVKSRVSVDKADFHKVKNDFSGFYYHIYASSEASTWIQLK